jgi:hypothetical protein
MGGALIKCSARGGVKLLTSDPVAYDRVRRNCGALPLLDGLSLEGRETAVDHDIRARQI